MIHLHTLDWSLNIAFDHCSMKSYVWTIFNTWTCTDFSFGIIERWGFVCRLATESIQRSWKSNDNIFNVYFKDEKLNNNFLQNDELAKTWFYILSKQKIHQHLSTLITINCFNQFNVFVYMCKYECLMLFFHNSQLFPEQKCIGH